MLSLPLEGITVIQGSRQLMGQSQQPLHLALSICFILWRINQTYSSVRGNLFREDAVKSAKFLLCYREVNSQAPLFPPSKKEIPSILALNTFSQMHVGLVDSMVRQDL